MKRLFSLLCVLCTIGMMAHAAKPVISLAGDQQGSLLAIGSSSPYAISTVVDDPTDPLAHDGILLNVTNSPTSFFVSSDNTSVVANANCSCTLVSGSTYRLIIRATGKGYATVSLTANNGSNSSAFKVKVAASVASERPDSTIFPTMIADASAAAEVGDDYMLVADDETNLIRLYNRKKSGGSIKQFDVTSGAGGTAGKEFDIEGASTSQIYPNRIYWITSLANNKSGKVKAERNRIFATEISGEGSSTTLTVKSYSTKMRDALIAWGDACGWNFTNSAKEGVIAKDSAGFNIEGLSLRMNGEEAFIGFRAPYVPLKNVTPTSTNRKYAVLAPVKNFETILNVSGQSSVTPTFGEPVLFNFGGLGIRSIEKAGTAGYLIIAGLYTGGGNPSVYLWNGRSEEDSGTNPISEGPNLVKLDIDLSNLVQPSSDGGVEGHPEALMATQDGNTITIYIICDNGSVDYYGDGNEAKALTNEQFRKFRQDIFTYIIPETFTTENEEITNDAPLGVRVIGNRIVTDDGGSITLYDLASNKVAQGFGEVVAKAGIYIVKTDNATAKVIIAK